MSAIVCLWVTHTDIKDRKTNKQLGSFSFDVRLMFYCMSGIVFGCWETFPNIKKPESKTTSPNFPLRLLKFFEFGHNVDYNFYYLAHIIINNEYNHITNVNNLEGSKFVKRIF